jgi:hypothetical protein
MLIIVLLLVAVVAIGVAWILRRRSASDAIAVYEDRRRPSSQLVSRGELIDGNRRMPVALALTDVAVFYENSDMQGSLERQWIHEIEYDDELTTGQTIGDGTVLRLRCFSQKFEFLLGPASVGDWKLALPPHRMSEA